MRTGPAPLGADELTFGSFPKVRARVAFAAVWFPSAALVTTCLFAAETVFTCAGVVAAKAIMKTVAVIIRFFMAFQDLFKIFPGSMSMWFMQGLTGAVLD